MSSSVKSASRSTIVLPVVLQLIWPFVTYLIDAHGDDTRVSLNTKKSNAKHVWSDSNN